MRGQGVGVLACVFEGVAFAECTFTEGVGTGEYTKGVQGGEAQIFDELHFVHARGGIEQEDGGVGIHGHGFGLFVAVDEDAPGALFVFYGQRGKTGGVDQREVFNGRSGHPAVDEADFFDRRGECRHFATLNGDGQAFAVQKNGFGAVGCAVLEDGDHIGGFERGGFGHGSADQGVD